MLLAFARLASAALNIIHDCDETFNYLEPLHYFLHGSGMQTWEYSAQYALRSWLYLLLHAPAAGAPALLGLGAGRGEQRQDHGECVRHAVGQAGLGWAPGGVPRLHSCLARRPALPSLFAAKLLGFLLLRAALGLVSAATETCLYR